MDEEDQTKSMPHTQSLQESVFQIWAQKQIDQCYRDTVQAYLAEMAPDEANLQLIKEHQKIMENKSQYYKIKQLANERLDILAEIYQLLKEQSQLQQVCEGLDQLRKINLKVCQAILSVREVLSQRGLHSEAVLKGYNPYFLQLNLDNQIIIKSYLSSYIPFSKNFDPFFLYPYEKIQNRSASSQTPQAVLKLFKMNISYVYRLIRAKNQIIKSVNLSSSTHIKEENMQNSLRKSIRNSQIKKQEVQSSEKEEQTQQNKQRRIRIVSTNKRRFKTILHDQQTSNQPKRRLSFRRQAESQPKTSQKQGKILKQESQTSTGPSPKFKIRRSLQTKKSGYQRTCIQNFDQSEDDDINAFRKKMYERKARRKISLNHSQAQEIEEEQQQQNKKQHPNLHLNLSKQFEICHQEQPIIMKRNLLPETQEDHSSQEQELMQSRNLQQSITSPGKIKFQQLRRIKQQYRRRKQRIKLQPLNKVQQNNEKDQQYQKESSNISSLQLRFMNYNMQQDNMIKKRQGNYYPHINQIEEMNKESSSGDSQKINQTAFSKQKQDQLRSINNKTTQLKYQHQKQFRLKKIPNIHKTSEEKNTDYFSHQSERLIAIKNLNQQNFADKHMRKSSMKRQSNEPIGIQECDIKQNKTVITSKFDVEGTKREKSNSPSRLQFHKVSAQKQSSRKQPQQKSAREGYKYKGQSQSNYPTTISPQRIIQTGHLFNDSDAQVKKKQIQMKPGQIKLVDLFSFIEKQKINDFQRKQFETGLWKQNIALKHSYLTKFYMDSQLTAFGISSPRSDGDYSILYWATTCAEKATSFMFKKYLDYLQKFTSLNNLYIGNQNYTNAGFQKVGNCFVRKRLNFQRRQQPYIPFLSLECSNICFQQTNDKESSIFYSQQIEQFSALNNNTNSIIGFCQKKNQINLPSKSKFYENVSTIYDINKILEALSIDTYATSQKIQIKQLKLFALKDNCSIKSNYFYVYDGYFAPKGVEIYSSQKSKILRLQMEKQDYFVYFGKKFQNIKQFTQICSQKSSGPDRFFAFKMFSKQLYGRLKNSEFLQSGCYGNWDISFLWQDQLKGTVIKDMPPSQYIFGPEKFLVAIFKSKQLLFAFEVKPSDFFF